VKKGEKRGVKKRRAFSYTFLLSLLFFSFLVNRRTSLPFTRSYLLFSALLFCSLLCSLIFSSHLSPAVKRKNNRGDEQRDERGTGKEQNHDSYLGKIFRVPIRRLIFVYLTTLFQLPDWRISVNCGACGSKSYWSTFNRNMQSLGQDYWLPS
jgi:hypothetical protein